MMAFSYRFSGSLLALALLVPGVAKADAAAHLMEGLQINGQPLPVVSVNETPLDGFYQVHLESGEAFYTDAEGNYLLVGDLYENGPAGLTNLTEQARSNARAEQLAAVPKNERVVFRGAEESRAEVVVFTDTTCPYCRQFHEEVPALNDMGIEVHYMAFPRAGMNSDGARVLEQIWCAENSSEAMSAAKRQETLSAGTSCDNPVESQYHLGMAVGVQGTPAIVLPDGQLVPGYVPAERLADMLGLAE